MARTIPVYILLLLPSFALAGDLEDALAAYSKKDYDLAIARLTAHIREHPRSAEAISNRGMVYSAKKEYGKAIEDYSEAIRLDPKSAEFYKGRGIAYGGKKDFDKAIKDFSESIRLDPKEASAYYNRGSAYSQKEEYEKAIKDYAEAIRVHPKLADAYSSRGAAYDAVKKYDQAIKDYTEAIRLEPNNPFAYNNLAWILATCPKDGVRDGKKAVEYATTACKLSEWKDSGNLDTLAAAYAESGDFKEAVKRQREAIKLGFDDRNVLQRSRQRLELYQGGKPYRVK